MFLHKSLSMITNYVLFSSILNNLIKLLLPTKIDELTGQMLSEKYVAWGTSNRARKAVIGIAPKGTSIAYNFRSLGYFVCTSRKIGKSLANQRCAKAIATIQQIKYMPNPMHEKLIFAELCSFTKLTDGSEICIPIERNL